jgi:hypothetical protein
VYNEVIVDNFDSPADVGEFEGGIFGAAVGAPFSSQVAAEQLFEERPLGLKGGPSACDQPFGDFNSPF